jgi:hypothetical protein
MRQLREAALIRIAAGEAKSYAEYSVDQGFVDIQNYYYAGTVTAALQGLATATGDQAVQTKVALDKVVNKKEEGTVQTIQ